MKISLANTPRALVRPIASQTEGRLGSLLLIRSLFRQLVLLVWLLLLLLLVWLLLLMVWLLVWLLLV
jgi:hypothetical protein